MRRALPAWLAGTVAAALAAFASLLPVIQQVESWSIDLLLRYGRVNPPRAHPRIVHVDIDDGAIDALGRWPWPRTLLAEALYAIDSHQPKVIALDILFSHPQAADYAPDGSRIDHDANLATALASISAKTVLAVRMKEEEARRGSLWTEGEGRERYASVLAALAADITLDAAGVIRIAGLEPERARRVEVHLRQFKKLAVLETVERLAREGALTEEALLAALVPRDIREGGGFPELGLMRQSLVEAQAVEALQRRFSAAQAGFPAIEPEGVQPPLPAFVKASDHAGVVDALIDRDGLIRRISLFWRRGGRFYPQFGLAAALAYLDLDASHMQVAPSGLRVGGQFLPARDGNLLLAWPRIEREFGALGLLRQHDADSGAAHHISLARVVDVARKQALLQGYADQRREISSELVKSWLSAYKPKDLDDPELAPRIELELEEEAARQLEGIEEVPEEERSELDRVLLRWVRLGKEIPRARRELLQGQAELSGALRGNLVFVGWNATGNQGEFYPTPVDARTPGVVVHAIAANSCLTGYAFHVAPSWMGLLAALLLGAAAAGVAARTGPRLALLVALLLVILWCAVDTLLVFNLAATALGWATPVAAILLAWAGATVVRAVQERREKAQLRRQFGARISPRLFDFLLKNPEMIHLQGQEREVTSFFSDLAGFTSISEALDTRTTVSVLNRYMWAMNEELTKHGAYVNKFLGDGIMAVWGALSVEPDHAERACRAALDCLHRLEALLREPDMARLPRLSMRVGIATGVVIVGDCGAPPDLQDYTVIGDEVNLAARLESVNKLFGTSILINARTEELLPDSLLLRPIGLLAVAGQESASEIHEVVALKGAATRAQELRVALTGGAVGLFREGKLLEAREAFEALGREHGDEKLAGFYRAEIARRLARPEEPFDAVLRLTAK